MSALHSISIRRLAQAENTNDPVDIRISHFNLDHGSMVAVDRAESYCRFFASHINVGRTSRACGVPKKAIFILFREISSPIWNCQSYICRIDNLSSFIAEKSQPWLDNYLLETVGLIVPHSMLLEIPAQTKLAS